MRNRTIHVRATVGPDHTIQVPAGDFPAGEELAVTVEAPATPTPPRKGPSALEIIESLPPGRNFKTAQEVDEYLRQERQSWER